MTPVAAVSLNKANISLEMNTKGQLSAAVSPVDAYDKSIVWASSDESVVKADKGLLTPVAPGTATVTATAYNGKSASCLVTITARPAPALPDTEGKTQVVVEPEIKENTVDDGAVKDALANAQPDEAVVVKVEVKDADEVKDVRVSAACGRMRGWLSRRPAQSRRGRALAAGAGKRNDNGQGGKTKEFVKKAAGRLQFLIEYCTM